MGANGTHLHALKFYSGRIGVEVRIAAFEGDATTLSERQLAR